MIICKREGEERVEYGRSDKMVDGSGTTGCHGVGRPSGEKDIQSDGAVAAGTSDGVSGPAGAGGGLDGSSMGDGVCSVVGKRNTMGMAGRNRGWRWQAVSGAGSDHGV